MTEKILSMKYPVSIAYQGRTFYRTGKEGECCATGQASQEYSYTGPFGPRGITMEVRVWLRADGTIEED